MQVNFGMSPSATNLHSFLHKLSDPAQTHVTKVSQLDESSPIEMAFKDIETGAHISVEISPQLKSGQTEQVIVRNMVDKPLHERPEFLRVVLEPVKSLAKIIHRAGQALKPESVDPDEDQPLVELIQTLPEVLHQRRLAYNA